MQLIKAEYVDMKVKHRYLRLRDSRDEVNIATLDSNDVRLPRPGTSKPDRSGRSPHCIESTTRCGPGEIGAYYLAGEFASEVKSVIRVHVVLSTPRVPYSTGKAKTDAITEANYEVVRPVIV